MTENSLNNNEKLNALINLVASGDSKAFSDLVEQYRPMLNRICNSYITDDMSREDVEDLEQEELVAFYRAIINFDCEREGIEFGLYAKICVTNSMISYKRATSKKTSNISILDDGELEYISDPDSEVSLIVEREESERMLGERIEKTLSEYENEVWSFYVNGYSSKEIAQKLKSNEKSIDNAIFRIRRKLKTLLNN